VNVWVAGVSHSSAGEAIANLLAAEGHGVIGTDRELVDVTDWESMDKFVEVNGPFDAAVYAVGIPLLEWVREADLLDLKEVFETNTFGFVGFMRALVEHQTSGRVLCLVSDASRTPMRGSLAYCASKAALEMAVRCCARELAPEWSINGLSPSTIEDTNMTHYNDHAIPAFRGWDADKAKEYELSMVPMHRRVTKQEVAEAAVSILTMPSFMSGEIVFLAGGK